MKNFTKKTVFCLIMATFFIIAACTKIPEKIGLKLDLKKGETYTLRTITKSKLTLQIQGEPQIISQNSEIDFKFKVKKIEPDGNAYVLVRFNKFIFNQQGNTKTIEYNSAKKTEDLQIETLGFTALAGKTFKISLSPVGEVKIIKGVYDIINDTMEQINIQEESLKENIKNNLISQYGNEALKEMLENILRFRPDVLVAVEESWNKKTIILRGTSMEIDSRFTLKENTTEVATIAVASTIKSIDKKEFKQNNESMNYSFSGEQTGEIQIDKNTGWIILSTINRNYTGYLIVKNMERQEETETLAHTDDEEIEEETEIDDQMEDAPAEPLKTIKMPISVESVTIVKPIDN